MPFHSIRGVTTATAATADHAVCAIWNPDAGRRIKIHEFSIFATAAPAGGYSVRGRRISARGTAQASQTSAQGHSFDFSEQAPSAFILDLGAYSAQPTLVTGDLCPVFAFAAVAASGLVYPIRALEVPPGAGFAVIQRAATAGVVFEVGFVIED